MTALEPNGAAVLLPSDADVLLVTLVPFATADWRAASATLPAHLTLADASGGAATGRRELPEGLLEDLRLWDYADRLADELRAYLPHRTTRIVAAAGHCLAPQAPEGATWHTESCVVDLWDLGIGLITSVHRLVGSAGTWDAIRGAAVTAEAKRSFLEQAELLIDDVLGAASDAPLQGGPTGGHALWVQGMFVVDAHAHTSRDALDGVAAVLTENGDRIPSVHDVDDVAVRLGIEVCVAFQGTGARSAAAVGRVVACQTAVWARAITLDLDLAHALQRATRDEIALPIDVLEARALDLLGVFEEVEQFGATVGTVAVHLAVRDKAYWECFRAAWGLDCQLQALSSNLDAVGHVYVHLTNALTSRQSRSLNDVLLAITMLNFAMFWIAVWEFTQKSFDPFSVVSAAVVAAALVSSVALFFGVRRLTRVTSASIARLGTRSRGPATSAPVAPAIPAQQRAESATPTHPARRVQRR